MERLQKVRDIFLFCCYTGYAPVDALNLTPANLFEDNDGNLWIMTNRTKTAIRENVPVLPPAMAVIKKYKNKQIGLLPQISNQKMNAYLKEIADICEINKHLTWYVSRHTFATTVTLGNGVRLEHVRFRTDKVNGGRPEAEGLPESCHCDVHDDVEIEARLKLMRQPQQAAQRL